MQNPREVDSGAQQAPWYRDGLRFECTRCGNCCSGTPGTVHVSDREIEELARHFSLSIEEFRTVYTRTLRKGAIALREKRNKECVFYDRDRGCTVYQQRPRQCRTWPFWRGVVATEERWTEEAEGCPGMNRGKLHRAAEISGTSHADGTSGFVPITLDT
jgi:Fe-S-cluster containining protein